MSSSSGSEAAAPGRLEGDADAAAGERRDGVVGEGRAQEVALHADHDRLPSGGGRPRAGRTEVRA